MSEKERLDQVSEEKKAKADAKKAKEKALKKSRGNRITRWLREMRSELKKVQWPTKKQTINNTLIVIACVIVVGLFIWIFDFVATEGINALIDLVSGLKK